MAQCEDTTLRYIHQDSLNSSSVMTDSSGTLDSSMTFYPFGAGRIGDVNTDKKFTGQRLDDTGLYYYGARYYDCTIGRFISSDTVVQSPGNPQTLNRYSYCLNNPLKYIDPSGNIVEFENEELMLWYINNGYLDISSDTEIGRMLDEWAELRCAWDELSEAAPEVAFVMENTDKVINIGFGNAGDHGAITIPDYPAWNDSPDENGNYIPNSFKIEINGNKIDNVTTLTGVLVHESFHILADLMGTTYKTMSVNGNRMWASNWRLEEAYAYSYQAQVLMKLGVGGGGNDYNSMIVNYFGGMSPGATYANLNASGSGFLQKYYYGYNIYPSEKSQKLGVLILSYYLLFPGQ